MYIPAKYFYLTICDIQQALKINVEKHLDRMKLIKDSIPTTEGVSGGLKEKLSEVQVLLTKLPMELKNRYDYLQTHLSYREEYANLREKFFDWSQEASEKVNVAEHGINFDHVDTDLEDHKVIN